MLHSLDYILVYTCVLLALQGPPHTHEHLLSSVPAPLQHPKPDMMEEKEEEEEEEDDSPSPAKKIRKLQNDEEKVYEDIL